MIMIQRKLVSVAPKVMINAKYLYVKVQKT